VGARSPLLRGSSLRSEYALPTISKISFSHLSGRASSIYARPGGAPVRFDHSADSGIAIEEHLQADILYDEPLVLSPEREAPWSRRRKVELPS